MKNKDEKVFALIGIVFTTLLILYQLYRQEVPYKLGGSRTLENDPISYWFAIGFDITIFLYFVYGYLKNR